MPIPIAPSEVIRGDDYSRCLSELIGAEKMAHLNAYVKLMLELDPLLIRQTMNVYVSQAPAALRDRNQLILMYGAKNPGEFERLRRKLELTLS